MRKGVDPLYRSCRNAQTCQVMRADVEEVEVGLQGWGAVHHSEGPLLHTACPLVATMAVPLDTDLHHQEEDTEVDIVDDQEATRHIRSARIQRFKMLEYFIE